MSRLSEDALSRATRINKKLADWQEKVAGDSTNAPLRIVELLAANPFITVKGTAEKLDVAFTTAQRAIEKLERLEIVRQKGMRNATGFIVRKRCLIFLKNRRDWPRL
jgi:Fic family protein